MSINAKCSLQGVVVGSQILNGGISQSMKLIGSVNVGGAILPEYYYGEYEITPNAETQILGTSQKLMEKDVVVAPIPKEYGLVTYNQDKTITIT